MVDSRAFLPFDLRTGTEAIIFATGPIVHVLFAADLVGVENALVDGDGVGFVPALDVALEQGFGQETVRRVAAMVKRNEYKRRQAPPGVRISKRAFGKDRRYPITSGYVDNSLGRSCCRYRDSKNFRKNEGLCGP